MPLKAQEGQTTNLAWCFKRFATALLKADASLLILNWMNPLKNPITKSGDIAYNKQTVKEYYAGMRILQSRKRVFGMVKVNTSVQFRKTKAHPNFWNI